MQSGGAVVLLAGEAQVELDQGAVAVRVLAGRLAAEGVGAGGGLLVQLPAPDDGAGGLAALTLGVGEGARGVQVVAVDRVDIQQLVVLHPDACHRGVVLTAFACAGHGGDIAQIVGAEIIVQGGATDSVRPVLLVTGFAQRLAVAGS